jgi:hypothetical protein
MGYEYGSKVFRTKTDIIKYFQAYHNSHDIGTILEGEYKSIMADLIKNHPIYDEWNIQEDIEFKIDLDDHKNKKYLIKNGNEWHTFSYLKCIKGGTKETNIRINVINAARRAINDQIVEFRKSCREDNLNSKPIFKDLKVFKCHTCCEYFKTIDVDHDFSQMTFQTILNNFIRFKKKEFTSFELVKTPNGSLFNSIDHNEWSEYHKKYAILRLLCRNCHQQKK